VTLKASYEGWQKSASRPKNTLREFGYAVARFCELHGDIEIARITRRHVLQFREALQEMPLRRSGTLRTATLPELVEWSKGHPGVEKASAETVNKLLGAVGAIAQWGRDNGLIADDVQWSNPFAKMSLPKRRSTREPWETDELRTLFGSPVFTSGERPQAGIGADHGAKRAGTKKPGARLGLVMVAPLHRARQGTKNPRHSRNNLSISIFTACRWYQSVGSDDESNERRPNGMKVRSSTRPS
jgi:hypothetical protein